MKVLHVLLSSVGLLAGIGAVFLSLSLASQVSSHEATRLTARELYWGEEILPDHLLYPAIMVMDRVQLENAESTERVYMEVVYAGRRLVYAQELLAKGKEELAITTVTKSQKYLLQAGKSALNEPQSSNPELLAYLLKAYTFHSRELEKFVAQLPESDTPVVTALSAELDLVYQQLLDQYKNL